MKIHAIACATVFALGHSADQAWAQSVRGKRNLEDDLSEDGSSEHRYIVKFKDDSTEFKYRLEKAKGNDARVKKLKKSKSSKQSANDSEQSSSLASDELFWLENFIPKAGMEVMYLNSSDEVEKWEERDDVEFVELDTKLYPIYDEPTNGFGASGHDQNLSNLYSNKEIPYGVTKVQALTVSDANVSNRKVCIIDSGYDISHPNLPSYYDDSVSGNFGPSDFKPWNYDWHGHGTHVAGTIAAAAKEERGVVGVLRNGQVNLHIIGVLDQNNRYAWKSDLYWAIGACADAGANVINMSLGEPASKIFDEKVCNRIFQEWNVLLIAAAGNDGNTTKIYPASYPSVMSVAATDSNNNHASFSQRNDQVDIAAPGVQVLSTFPNYRYQKMSGTNKSAQEIRKALQESAQHLGPEGRNDLFGHGLVRADEAMRYLAKVGYVWGIDHKGDVLYRREYRVTWQKIEGKKFKQVAVGSNGKHVWGLTPNGEIWYCPDIYHTLENVCRNTGQGKMWKQVTVSDDGQRVWGVDQSNIIHHRLGIAGSRWIPSLHWLYLKQVSISNNDSAVGVDENNNIWYRFTIDTGWHQIPGKMKQVAISDDGSDVWGVGADDEVYNLQDLWGKDIRKLMLNRLRFPLWKKVGDGQKFKQVTVSNGGNHVWAVNFQNEIYHCTGRHGFWQKVEGQHFKNVVVSRDGNYVFGVDLNDEISFRKGYSGSWEDDVSWQAVAKCNEKLKQVASSTNGKHVWAVDVNKGVWYLAGPYGTWKKVEGKELEQVTVSHDGRSVWGVDSEGNIWYKEDHLASPWRSVLQEKKLVQVAISNDGKHLWGVGLDRKVYYGKEFEGGQGNDKEYVYHWKEIQGHQLAQVAVSSDGKHVWGVPVDRNKEVVYRVGHAGVWQDVKGSSHLIQLSVSDYGSHVWGLDSDKKVWYRAGHHGHWVFIPEKKDLEYISN